MFLDKDTQEGISFYQWILENWTIEGGLIPQATAARLMEVSKARVTQMINEGKLKEFRYENQVFVPYSQTMKIARQKQYQKMKQMAEEEFAKINLPPALFNEFRNGTLGIIEKSKKIIK